jgi:hypothetical protein
LKGLRKITTFLGRNRSPDGRKERQKKETKRKERRKKNRERIGDKLLKQLHDRKVPHSLSSFYPFLTLLNISFCKL